MPNVTFHPTAFYLGELAAGFYKYFPFQAADADGYWRSWIERYYAGQFPAVTVECKRQQLAPTMADYSSGKIKSLGCWYGYAGGHSC
jgi:hypothetical protein